MLASFAEPLLSLDDLWSSSGFSEFWLFDSALVDFDGSSESALVSLLVSLFRTGGGD